MPGCIVIGGYHGVTLELWVARGLFTLIFSVSKFINGLLVYQCSNIDSLFSFITLNIQ